MRKQCELTYFYLVYPKSDSAQWIFYSDRCVTSSHSVLTSVDDIKTCSSTVKLTSKVSSIIFGAIT